MIAAFRVTIMAIAALLGMPALAAPSHGIAMHGEPALPPDFAHLPHAEPTAPTGGTFSFGAIGGFDSLNPFILRGRAPGEIRAHTVESLMGRNWDEPFALYGLLAESVETSVDRRTVTFTLRPEARFADGTPVTVDDVLWSMETLAAVGRPNFRAIWAKVETVERPGPRQVRFTFNAPDREAPMILGLVPVLSRAQFEGRDLGAPTLEPIMGSGPYTVAAFEAGRFLELRRNADYWGRDLPFNAGLHRFDTIRVEYFRDGNALFDALKAGQISLFREGDPQRWENDYDFPAIAEGRLVRAEIPHGRPTGMHGFVFNTRNPLFADLRVRQALGLAFNADWINEALFGGGLARIDSYFANSPLAFRGAAEGRERSILEAFAADLPPGTLEAPAPAVQGDSDPRNRRGLRAAARLLEAAGWSLQGTTLRNAAGEAFTFEILLGSSADERVAGIFRDGLATLGIEARVRTIDSAQYQERLTDYQFDMIVNRWGLSLSPGNEQRLYWGSAGRTEPGTRNYMGVASPAVDTAIDALLGAESLEDFEAAARALDRVLTAGHYVIPFWFSPVSRIVHDARLRYPARLPLYGDWIGWAPEVWWQAP
jgi:peptide/nickel transport system substrate-binding protein